MVSECTIQDYSTDRSPLMILVAVMRSITSPILAISLSTLARCSLHNGDHLSPGVIDPVVPCDTEDLRSMLDGDGGLWHAAVGLFDDARSLGSLTPLSEHDWTVRDPFGSSDPNGTVDASLPNPPLLFPTDLVHDIPDDFRADSAHQPHSKRHTNEARATRTTTVDPMPKHGRRRSSRKRDSADDEFEDAPKASWFREQRRVVHSEKHPGSLDIVCEESAKRTTAIVSKLGPMSSISRGAVEAPPLVGVAKLAAPRGRWSKITSATPACGLLRASPEQKLYSLDLLIGDPEMDTATVYNLTQARFPRADPKEVRMLRKNLLSRLRVESLVHDELLARAVSDPDFTAQELEAAVSSRFLEATGKIPRAHVLDTISRWRMYCIIPHLSGHSPPPCQPYDHVRNGRRSSGVRLSTEMSITLFRDLYARWSEAAVLPKAPDGTSEEPFHETTASYAQV